MSKKEWLQAKVMVDEWGRPPSLADVPMTIMTSTISTRVNPLLEKRLNNLKTFTYDDGINKTW